MQNFGKSQTKRITRNFLQFLVLLTLTACSTVTPQAVSTPTEEALSEPAVQAPEIQPSSTAIGDPNCRTAGHGPAHG